MTAGSIQDVFQQGEGILRMIPNWVPRHFNQPGRRLRLHPDDYFALGLRRGAIKERWFSSIVSASNGPLAPPEEGLSYVAASDRIEDRILFKDVVEALGADLIGEQLQKTYGTWPMYSKFFDYQQALFHHLHPDDAAAANVGRVGKPEAYYFPPQLNNHLGDFPVTYFGFDHDVSRDEVRRRLLDYERYDTHITQLSRAYRLELGTGWYTPPGVVHAPGSVLTYEPQWNSDVSSVFENVTAGEVSPYDWLVADVPQNKQRDVNYIMNLLDWEKNVDPFYKRHYFRPALLCPHSDERHVEKWIVYANDYFGAKELTVMPEQSVVISDEAAYGCIIVQGHGAFGPHPAEAAVLLRFGQLSGDEFFVSETAAKRGVTITNHSRWEPMVILKHFGPNHPHMPTSVVAETSDE